MNNKILSNIGLFVFALMMSFSVQANINVGQPSNGGDEGKPDGPKINTKVGDCVPATAQTELNVNNVRCTLLAGGDLWWNLSDARYEIPKVDPSSGEVSKHSIFAGALWIGGIDALGQLKVAAMTYRQTGNDFFPGPLDSNGEIAKETCNDFDRFWETGRTDIDAFLAIVDANDGIAPKSLIPESILGWPGKNNIHFEEVSGFEMPEGKQLAPFWDANSDGDYNPEDGDYPVIDPEIEGVYGDQMIWWVFNDKGNVHSETGGQAIGLEVSSLAFAFSTNDEVNNMTFYKYVVDNKSTADLNDTYFGQWVDPDLGNYLDDYVGCVPSEGLGIVYNGDALDDGTAGYGEEIPMLGVDFFKGPTIPCIDEIGDTIKLDEAGNVIFEELGMSSFLFYNNDFSVLGNPETATHFYNYLSGFWKDGTPFTCGDNGYGGAIDTCAFIFPDDPPNPDGWSECALGIQPADRRFLQVAGPFTLEPGAVNDVIVGVVWTREGLTYPCPSFESIIKADQQAQALFDSGFKLANGPDAPNLTLREMDQQLILSVWNPQTSNNYLEQYAEANAVLAASGDPDSLYTFQGYRIYQLANGTVTSAEYGDPDKAREIFQVDIEDGVTQIVNIGFDAELGVNIPEIMVNGQDNGIDHSFVITDDQFATGDKSLVNHKPYFFSVVAYAYNAKEGWETPYLLGRNNIRTYTAIPHKNSTEFGGLVANAAFGDGPEITKISGLGNSANFLELTESSKEAIINNSGTDPVYQSGAGPVNVKIVDPLLIPSAKFRLSFEDGQFFTYTQPESGVIVDDGELFTFETDPDEAYTEFTYEIINEAGYTDIGYVSVINNALTSSDDLHLFSDSRVISLPTSGSVDINVLDNDVYDEDIPLNLLGFSSPSRGSLVAVTDTTFDEEDEEKIDYVSLLSFEYTPNSSDVEGGDSFTYTLRQNGKTETANVFLNLQNSANTAIINAVDDQYTLGFPMIVLSNDESDLIGSSIITGGATWDLEVVESANESELPLERVYESDGPITIYNEQAIGGWEFAPIGATTDDSWKNNNPLGFTVGVRQAVNPDRGNAFIEATLTHESAQNIWLSTISDSEGESPLNWIRSGEVNDLDTPYYFDNGTWGTGNVRAYDAESFYEGVLGGGIAPYSLVANPPGYNEISLGDGTAFSIGMSPGCSDCYEPFGVYQAEGYAPPTQNLSELNGVDIIITNDKSLWTRAAVVDVCRACEDDNGNLLKNGLRNSASIDINGNTIEGDRGMSYFPGYAIDVDTGERLNIMFAENSDIGTANGRDMLWNPTDELFVNVGGSPSAFGLNNFRMGGEHYVYIMKSKYDEGADIQDKLSIASFKKEVYDDVMWVMAPLSDVDLGNTLKEGMNGEDGQKTYNIPSDVEIKVRVSRSYESDASGPPVYEFDFTNLAPTQLSDDEFAGTILDEVQVVPNPYYAISNYEQSKFENLVKITNLPERAVIRIFTLDGTLVRQLEVDNGGANTTISGRNGTVENAITWDLKNHRNIPVASGLYIFNIEAPDYGESKTLKWFGVIRPIDLETF